MKKTKKNKVGAKSILTHQPEKVKVFFDGIQLGQTVKDAAEFAGISESVIYDWQARGKQELIDGKDTEFTQFVEAFNRAKQSFIRNALFQMFQASKKDWRAAAYLLKMRYPETYGDKQVFTFEKNKEFVDAVKELSDSINEIE